MERALGEAGSDSDTHRVHEVKLFLLHNAAVIKGDSEVRVVKHMCHASKPDLKEA